MVVLALAILSATPAASACHHFSVWKYPTPQQCGAGHGNGRDKLVRLARSPDRSQGNAAAPQVDAAPNDRAYRADDLPPGWGIKELWEAVRKQDKGR